MLGVGYECMSVLSMKVATEAMRASEVVTWVPGRGVREAWQTCQPTES